MTIRPATPEDVPAVLPMVAAIARLHESWDPAKYAYLPAPEEMYRSWLRSRAKDPNSVFLVAEREGKLVGFIVGTIEREIPIYRIERFGFIHDLWIEPEYRHEGTGKQMTMLAVEKFRELGVPQVRCDTAWLNEPARKLFENCGFRPSIVEMLLELR